ncbi:MAG: EpsI family protein [Nitrospirae bacterium]|nr:EpsI family protein [Nitrospirota bacterium]
MNKKARYITAILLISLAMLLSFAVPKDVKYEGTAFLSGLRLPDSFGEWSGQDMSVELRDELQGAVYEFISEALLYQYTHKPDGRKVLLMIINARDFHYPDVCFRSSGFTTEAFERTPMNASGRLINAYTLFTDHAPRNDKRIVVYWIAIDKKLVSGWAEQKIIQTIFSLFNRKSVSLLVRIDVPVYGADTGEGAELAKKFASDLSRAMSESDADYLFGTK